MRECRFIAFRAATAIVKRVFDVDAPVGVLQSDAVSEMERDEVDAVSASVATVVGAIWHMATWKAFKDAPEGINRLLAGMRVSSILG